MYTLIEHKKLENSSLNTISFSSIPLIYTDLVLMMSAKSTDTTQTFRGGYAIVSMRLNGSGTGFSSRILSGDGASALSYTSGDTSYGGRLGAGIKNTVGASPGFDNFAMTFPNYTSSSQKSFSIDRVGEGNQTNTLQEIIAGLWTGTDPISSISLQVAYGNYEAGSSFTLYGINRTQAIGKPKAVGGNITYANGYWVHTFTGSGSFYAQEDLTCDYLVVAGGGGAGGVGLNFGCGGAGAGGYRTSAGTSGGGASAESALTLETGTNYTVTVGAGGPGGAAVFNSVTAGNNGSNSVFSTITSVGGGRGGVRDIEDGQTGGSGGGGSSEANRTAGSGTANQGYAGGAGNLSTISGQGRNGGGGGGASATGVAGVNAEAGDGGAGVASSITGTSVTRAGGGGGGIFNATAGASAVGSGGVGGGGNGGSRFYSTPPQSGIVNSGGGGGGTGGWEGTGAYAGGNGGSGVVIVRYRAD
jgi:hypothetical protein